MDAEEANGLTLQGLAQRLETLERENAELRSKVATLEESGTRRDETVEKRGSDKPRDEDTTASVFEGQVSRRSLLSKAGAAALGAVAAGTLLNPHEAKANHVYGPNATINANEVRTHTLVAENTQGTKGTPAVWGRSMENQGPGVSGRTSATNYSAVRGVHEGLVGFGVAGHGRGQDGAGVLGENVDGYGVIGQCSRGIGGRFTGGRAQLALTPGSIAGKPTDNTHQQGEIYMDSGATLFVCTAGGSPGTWMRVQTVAT